MAADKSNGMEVDKSKIAKAVIINQQIANVSVEIH